MNTAEKPAVEKTLMQMEILFGILGILTTGGALAIVLSGMEIKRLLFALFCALIRRYSRAGTA